jgi:hypothetical protein
MESSNEQIVGEYWQVSEIGTVFMLPLQRPGEEERYFINCFRFPSCKRNYIVLSDPYGSGPLVQMEFYNRAGELIKIASKLLRPYSTLAFEVDDYTSWDALGKVSIRSFGGSIVLHYRQLYGNEVVLAVPARSPAEELFVDEFSTGRDITGNLVIADASAEGPATKIQFRDDRGLLRYELEKLLPPNGTVLIDPSDYIDDLSFGTIEIIGESRIIADYWEKNPQNIIDTPAFSTTGSVLLISHFSPFDDAQGLLSLLNVGQEPMEVRAQFYTDDGGERGIRELLLEPYSQVDELLGRYFDGARLGTIIIRGASSDLIATSHLFDLGSNRHLGKVHAQIIR